MNNGLNNRMNNSVNTNNNINNINNIYLSLLNKYKQNFPRTFNEKVQKLTDKINGVTRENIQGIRVIHAFNAEKFSEKRFNDVNEDLKLEYRKYFFAGWMLLFLNIALSIMVFFMVYWNKTFNHHEITTIALAAYTFTSFTVAIISYIKYKKFKSPVYSAAKSISLTSACVSIITLEATMLTSFGSDMDIAIRKLFLGLTGGVVSLFVVFLAINIIVNGTRQIKNYKEDSSNG